jgi:hypothetical protein
VNRRLTLKRERLAELSSDELALLGGAQPVNPTPPSPTPVPLTYGCRPTLKVNECIAIQSGKTECLAPLLPTYQCTPVLA